MTRDVNGLLRSTELERSGVVSVWHGRAEGGALARRERKASGVTVAVYWNLFQTLPALQSFMAVHWPVRIGSDRDCWQ